MAEMLKVISLTNYLLFSRSSASSKRMLDRCRLEHLSTR